MFFAKKNTYPFWSIGMSIGMRLEADKQTQPLPPTGSGCGGCGMRFRDL